MRDFKEMPVEVNDNRLVNLLKNIQSQFERVCFLNSNNYNHDNYSSFDWLLAFGLNSEFKSSDDDVFKNLKSYIDEVNDWIFGGFSYDLKNQIENLSSKNFCGYNLDLVHFFQPLGVIIFKNNNLYLGLLPGKGKWSNHKEVVDYIFENNDKNEEQVKKQTINITPKVDKRTYLSNVKDIKKHIQEGNIYEVNYCIEFYDNKAEIDPLSIYLKLNEVSPAPFSAYFKIGDKYVISSSPERFLKKCEQKVISQPIKGTIKRGSNLDDDINKKKELLNNSKERSENVMIVDLVRNDLSRTAKKGSVKVEELFGIYSFPQVHHMISTITSTINENCNYMDVIKSSFPMGSMTGAPKIKAMGIIENFENSRRGVYSGSLGYITPEKDFDFNVVIRSIIYDKPSKFLSYMTGGAITDESNPEDEYLECLLKAKAMNKVLDEI